MALGESYGATRRRDLALGGVRKHGLKAFCEYGRLVVLAWPPLTCRDFSRCSCHRNLHLDPQGDTDDPLASGERNGRDRVFGRYVGPVGEDMQKDDVSGLRVPIQASMGRRADRRWRSEI